MGFIGRLAKGAINVLTTPLRVATLPFRFALNMGKTALSTLGKLAKFDIGGAISTLVGGTLKNTLNAGITLAAAGNPFASFMQGFAMNKAFC